VAADAERTTQPTLAAEATVVVAAVAAGAVTTAGIIQENGCVQSVSGENELGDDVEQIGAERGLSAAYGSSSGLAAQDEQADDLVTGAIFGAGTATAVVATSAGGDSTGGEFESGGISGAARFILALPICGRVCSSTGWWQWQWWLSSRG